MEGFRYEVAVGIVLAVSWGLFALYGFYSGAAGAVTATKGEVFCTRMRRMRIFVYALISVSLY